MKALDGATAVVTGSSRGIGRAIVERLVAEGAAVVFGYATDLTGAEAVSDQVRAEGGRAWAVQADLADPARVEQLFATADTHLGDRLDVLVNNAAIPGRIALTDATVTDFDRVLAVNTRAVFLAIQPRPLSGTPTSNTPGRPCPAMSFANAQMA